MNTPMDFVTFQARGSLQATLSSLLGDVGAPAETSGAIPPGWSLPLPLPWTGASDYGNTINAPQVRGGHCWVGPVSSLSPASCNIPTNVL